MDATDLLAYGTQLLEQGKTKDAYTAFLNIVELSTQQLHSVQFDHQKIVSKPIDFQLLKSSINQLEKISYYSSNRTHYVNFDQDLDVKNENFMSILSEACIKPCNLVPAQTNTRDSLVLPSSNSQLDEYIPNIPSPPLLTINRILQKRLNDLESNNDNQQLASITRTSLEKVRNLYMSAMTIQSILQFHPQLVAYQLTLIESSIFKSIPKHALLSHSTRTPHKKIVASTDFFNFVTRSIEHSILLPQEASTRAELIHRWIKIASKLLALNNYQTLKAVVSALRTPPIQRLRRTWHCIPKKRMTTLEFLSNLMSETDNYRKYRHHINLEHPRMAVPVVPFLGVFIHDVTYLSTACKGNGQDVRVQEVLNSIQHFQKAPDYPPQPIFKKKKNFLTRLNASKQQSSVDTTAFLGHGQEQEEEIKIELEQQLITQFLLMRPWVSEKTIDTLSLVREPSKPRSISSPTSYSHIEPTVSYSTSFISDERKPMVRWPFRKSNDICRTQQEWSEDDDDSVLHRVNSIRSISTIPGSIKNRHSRSLSLPSKSFELSDILHA